MDSLTELKDRVWKSNMELFKKNLVVHTFGNVSGFDKQKGVMAIKPSGVAYSELTSDMIVLVDLENQVIDSRLKPSSDTKTHLVLYKANPEIGGVAHTHSPYATAWAQSNQSVPCLGTTHADYCRGEIPCTSKLSKEQIDGDYETETGEQIIKKIKNCSLDKLEMILVAGHGPFTWGESPEKAVHNTELLEEICKIALFTKIINPGVKHLDSNLLDKHFLRKHGSKSYYGQE